MALINEVVLPFLKVSRAVRRVASVKLGDPDYSLVKRFTSHDKTVEYIEIRLPPRPHVIIFYATTRSVVAPRDLSTILRRMKSWLSRHAPPDYDATYAIVGDGTRFTSGVVSYAVRHRIVLDDKRGRKLRNRIVRYYSSRLVKLYEAVRRTMTLGRLALSDAAILMSLLAAILAKLLGRITLDELERRFFELVNGIDTSLVDTVLSALGIGPPP